MWTLAHLLELGYAAAASVTFGRASHTTSPPAALSTALFWPLALAGRVALLARDARATRRSRRRAEFETWAARIRQADEPGPRDPWGP